MRQHPFFLIGWLLVATVLLSLIGLTVEPVPSAKAGTYDVELIETKA